jgi:hypothetical protein
MKTFILSILVLAAMPAVKAHAQFCGPLNAPNLVVTSNTNITSLSTPAFVNICGNATVYDTVGAGFGPAYYVHSGCTLNTDQYLCFVYAKSGSTVVLAPGNLCNVYYESGATITNLPTSAIVCTPLTLPQACPGLGNSALSEYTSPINIKQIQDGYIFENNSSTAAHINLIDLKGQVQYTRSFTGALRITSDQLCAGLYILQIAQGDVHTVQKIVIQ